MSLWSQSKSNQQAADGCTCKSGQTPKTMIGGHDGPSIYFFRPDGLCVHGNIKQVSGHSKKKKTGNQFSRSPGKSEEGQSKCIQQGRAYYDWPAAEFSYQPSCDRKGNQ